jgi:hypothetical protein
MHKIYSVLGKDYKDDLWCLHWQTNSFFIAVLQLIYCCCKYEEVELRKRG